MLNYSLQNSEDDPLHTHLLAERLKTLAEPRRLQIFNLLMEGVQCNCELVHALKMPPNLVSHHLRKLLSAGLVIAERDTQDARWVYYSINREALDQLNQAFGDFFNPARIQARLPACGPRLDAEKTIQTVINPGKKQV